MCREYSAGFLNASDYARESRTDEIHLDTENHWKLAEGIAEKLREIKARGQESSSGAENHS